jgi:hypothetical protein
VRGLNFTREHLLDFALRRFSSVLKWAGVILVLSTLLIDLPLILKNFAPFASLLPETAVLNWTRQARIALAAFCLAGATIQITLTFHGESLFRAVRDHLRFLWKHGWRLAWFLAVAVIHLFFIHVLGESVSRGVGEGTSLWVTWKLCYPWLWGLMVAWLLASWVCLFRQCDTGRTSAPAIRF